MRVGGAASAAYPSLHLDIRAGGGSGSQSGGHGTGSGAGATYGDEDEDSSGGEEDGKEIESDPVLEARRLQWENAVNAMDMPEQHGNYDRIFPLPGNPEKQEKLAALLRSAEEGGAESRREKARKERDREALERELGPRAAEMKAKEGRSGAKKPSGTVPGTGFARLPKR